MGASPIVATMDMNDVPKRFIIRASHPIMKALGLDNDKFGIFFPDIGEYIIVSEERGYDEFQCCPEDVEWLD